MNDNIITPNTLNGLPHNVSKEWGHPYLVTRKRLPDSRCSCPCCAGHDDGEWVLMPESEWYWKPSVVDMSLVVPLLMDDRKQLFEAMSKLGEDTHEQRWI